MANDENRKFRNELMITEEDYCAVIDGITAAKRMIADICGFQLHNGAFDFDPRGYVKNGHYECVKCIAVNDREENYGNMLTSLQAYLKAAELFMNSVSVHAKFVPGARGENQW